MTKPITTRILIYFSDYQKGKLGLFELMDVQERASGILGCKADVMTRDCLHKALRQRIEVSAWQKQWLVQRGVEIISEASRHLP